jgi:hypothetical protein
MFIVAGYNFKSAMNNTAIHHFSIYARRRWLRRRRKLSADLTSNITNFVSTIVGFAAAADCSPPQLSLPPWRVTLLSQSVSSPLVTSLIAG